MPLPLVDAVDSLNKATSILYHKIGDQNTGLGEIVEMIVFNAEFLKDRISMLAKEL